MGQRKDRGQSLVEMALVLPILLLILFGIMEFSRVADAWLVATNAAREGARYGAVRRPAAEVADRTFAYLQRGLAGREDVTYSREGITVANAQGIPGSPVVVTVQVQVEMFTPLFQAFTPDGGTRFPVSQSAVMANQ